MHSLESCFWMETAPLWMVLAVNHVLGFTAVSLSHAMYDVTPALRGPCFRPSAFSAHILAPSCLPRGLPDGLSLPSSRPETLLLRKPALSEDLKASDEHILKLNCINHMMPALAFSRPFCPQGGTWMCLHQV